MGPGFLSRLAVVATTLALAGSAAPAATLTEASLPGGAFGARYDTPTVIGAGIERISGTGSQNVFDNFVFTALPKGAQTLTLSFSAPAGIGYSYSAGGAVLYDTQAFDYGWDGAYAGTVQIDYYQRQKSLDLALGNSFSGKLFLALNFTHGRDLAYTISVPSNAVAAMPPPVPLPPSALLIGAAVAGLGALRLRRRPA